MGCDNFSGMANKRIVLQPRTEVADSYGGQTVTWATSNLTVWAIMEPASGREVFQQGQKQARVDTKITIRYQSALSNVATGAKYRVSFDNRIFPVLYVKNLDEDMKREGKAYQVLYCGENDPENS